tara:strand:+ start:196 stop:600 length:405 start_codon:yes stop_codon:yes gene_type:complete
MELIMAKANQKWTFSIKETKELEVHPKSGLITWSVSGVATSPEGADSFFIATNNLDPRYPDRFKVNWNGKNPRMPKPTGHGVADEVKAAAHSVSKGFLLSRGARIAIARQCKLLLGDKLVPVAKETPTLTLAKS